MWGQYLACASPVLIRARLPGGCVVADGVSCYIPAEVFNTGESGITLSMRSALTASAKRVVLLLGILVPLVIGGLVVRRVGLLDRHFIYFPERELVGTPADVGLEYEDILFEAADGVKLHGWFVPGDSGATLLWFHGNAGNISHRLDNIAMLHHRVGVSIFIFDYRGYGQSSGTVSEEGTYLDAEAAIEYLRSRADAAVDQNVVLFGRSLGCAVAVEMAVRHTVHAVILESPFASIRDMAHRTYPYLPSGVMVRMVKARYDSISKIGSVHSPVMVLHGDRDDLVPIETGRDLFEGANQPKRFYVIEGAGHNDTYIVGGEPYLEALKAFIEDPAGAGG